MDATEAVRTKLDVREFDRRPVPASVKLKVLEAARLTQSAMNSQHWRFILLEGKESVGKLAALSTTGGWVAGADFAVVILTDPAKTVHIFDAGRAVQDMELTAWDAGVASGMFTGFKVPELKKELGIPDGFAPVAAIGFGYPVRTLKGRKKRKPLAELAFLARFGGSLGELEGRAARGKGNEA